MEWLWLKQAGSTRAYALKLAANLPGGKTAPADTELVGAEARLRRIRQEGLFSDETADAIARTFGVSTTILDGFLRSEVAGLDDAVNAASELLGSFGTKKFSLLEVAVGLLEYRRRFSEAEGLVQVLSMARPRLLEQIFTPVQVEAPVALGLLAQFDLTPDDPGRLGQRQAALEGRDAAGLVDGVSIANQEERLNILGEPGAGKSTLLRRVGGLAFQRLMGKASMQFEHACVPVFVELKNFDPKEQSLQQLVESKFLAAELPAGFGSFLWQSGGLLLLLDGLDEVPEDRVDEVVTKVREEVPGCKGSRWIGSCRTAAYRNQWTGFRTVTVAPFDNTQIQRFIKGNWFAGSSKERRLGDALWRKLLNRRHASVLSLARSPLLLTFICLVHESEKRLPSNRARLYEKVLRIMMREWAAQKGVHAEPPFPGLSPTRELRLLQQIAGPSFEKNQGVFEREELTEAIQQFLVRILGAPARTDPEPVLDRIRLQQGIFVGDYANYAFSHTTVHEFLAARHFHHGGEAVRLARENIFDARWREVFLLMANLSKDGTALLAEMLESLRIWWATNPKIKRFRDWSASVVDDTGDGRLLSARRLAVMTLARMQGALRELSDAEKFTIFTGANYDISVARDLITMLSPKLAEILRIFEDAPWDISHFLHVDAANNVAVVESLATARVFKPGVDEALRKSMVPLQLQTHRLFKRAGTEGRKPAFKFRASAEAWLRGMQLPEELWRWSEDEALKLSMGLLAMELIVECRQATRISADLWNRIAVLLLDPE